MPEIYSKIVKTNNCPMNNQVNFLFSFQTKLLNFLQPFEFFQFFYAFEFSFSILKNERNITNF